jgi:type III restriction enzyme
MIGCTCGKFLGFTDLHKKRCALRNKITPNIPIIGCTCGKNFGFTGVHKSKCALVEFQPVVAEKPLFNTQREQEVACATLRVLKQFERWARSNDLNNPDNIQKILARVQTATVSAHGQSASVTRQVEVQNIASKTIDLFMNNSIDIPKIVLVPTGEMTVSYRDFDLDLTGLKSVPLRPVPKDMLVAHDQTGYRREEKLEDHIVRGLVDFDDVSYHDHNELLYKLAGVLVQHLQSYLGNEDDIRNVLQFYQAELVNIVHSQLQRHCEKKVIGYEAHLRKDFTTLRPNSYFVPLGESLYDLRFPMTERRGQKKTRPVWRSKIRPEETGDPRKPPISTVLFGGFKRCLSPFQRFQSDTEHCFAVLLEDESDPSIVKWLKPSTGVFQIHYKGTIRYEPDYVVETKTGKLICDIKSAKDIKTNEVRDRANAAAKWCEYATAREKQNGGKPWSYLLIPEDAVKNRPAWALWRTFLKIESPKQFHELFG